MDESALLPEVGAFVHGLKESGQIAVDTPELRLFVQERLFVLLASDVRDALAEEFLSAEEAEELLELLRTRDVAGIEEQIGLLLPQHDERIRAALSTIEEELTGR